MDELSASVEEQLAAQPEDGAGKKRRRDEDEETSFNELQAEVRAQLFSRGRYDEPAADEEEGQSEAGEE